MKKWLRKAVAGLSAAAVVFGSAGVLPEGVFDGWSIAASAVDIVDSGTCGDNLTWTLDDEGMLTISGTGQMTNYTEAGATPWNKNSIKSIVIGTGVKSIGNSVFWGCCNLKTIFIPSGTKERFEKILPEYKEKLVEINNISSIRCKS